MAQLLATNSLSKSFGGLKAVHDVSLVVEKGSVHGLIGPNGAGKTTFFNMLTGNYLPTGGRVIFKGQDITGAPPERVVRMGIARTFQGVRLFKNMSALDNVKVGFHRGCRGGVIEAILRTPQYRREEGSVAERSMALLSRLHLEGHAGDMAANLPYGLQRRLEIARALATQPELLLLDEPAAGMNSAETQELMELIRGLAEEGLTLLVIEHDMRLIMNVSDTITVLDHGEKICEGPPALVRDDAVVIEAYLGKGSRLRRRAAGKGGASHA